ncbi:hypothetical protein, partial [Klebsiella michiganensis]|uniref:hypothetical protein n=1 Tax=Klebsiella michiganensis TaxID=1134687 RepID=UPI002981B5E1
GKNSLNRLIRCVCGKKIGPDPRNFNQRVSLGRNDLLIRTFPRVFKANRSFLNSRTVVEIGSLPSVQEVIDSSFALINSYISMHYPTSHMPRFFENTGKVDLVMNIERSAEQDNEAS